MSDLKERLRGDLMTPYQATQLMDEAADRIEQLEAALRAVMDDLTLIGKNHWLPVGLLDDVIYVNARAELEKRT